jgi:general stress protein YciG
MTDKTNRGLGSTTIDPQIKHDIQSKGGQASSQKQDMSQLGQKGGQAAQSSGNAHQLTDEDRSKGGQTSSQTQDMSALGQKGGNASHPQGRGLQNADEETREEVARMGGQSSHGAGRKSE